MEATRVRRLAGQARRSTLRALRDLLGGLGTAALALGVLLWLAVVAVTSLIGVGLVLRSSALRALHAVADVERARLSWRGAEVLSPGPRPDRWREARADPATRRELSWLAGHASVGLLLGVAGIQLPVWALRDGTF